MKKVKDLQDLINEKAIQRLDKDLYEAMKLIRTNSILKRTSDFPQISMGEGLKKQHPYWFFETGSEYMNKVKEYLLPIYIEEETKMFMSKVDNLQGQIDELLNNQVQSEDLPY